MSAANLLIGSTCSSIYILRCDPSVPSVVLKTTITAGTAPIQLVVDVPMKSFYALDLLSLESSTQVGQGNWTGRILTLSPSEFGSMEISHSLSLPLAEKPLCMTHHKSTLYVLSSSAYAVVKTSTPQKSTRRRRESVLDPITEDALSESLDELYRISKAQPSFTSGPEAPAHGDLFTAFDFLQGNDTIRKQASTTMLPGGLNDPRPALKVVASQMTADSNLDVPDLINIIPFSSDASSATNSHQILRFAPLDDFLVGITPSTVLLHHVLPDGTLTIASTLTIKESGPVVDLAITAQSIFIVTHSAFHKLTVNRDLQLEMAHSYPLEEFDTPRQLVACGKRAYIRTDTSLHLVDLEIGSSITLECSIHSSSTIALSQSGHLLFIANQQDGQVDMHHWSGKKLASCTVQQPCSIIQMS